jgi:hypothetical protein
VPRGERLQLSAGLPRSLEVANREHDLDICREHGRALAGFAGLVQDPADGGARGTEVPLGEAQQGQTGLGLAAAAAGLAIGPSATRKSPSMRWISPRR